MKFDRPTREIAVSVEYDYLEDLPKIGARGERHVAREMRNIAIRYGVPLASNATLAEQLGKCSPLEALPEELYEELAYVICNQTRRNY